MKGYTQNHKSVNISGIQTIKQQKNKRCIYRREQALMFKSVNSTSLLITINFKIYKIYSQLTEINREKIITFVLQVHIICNGSNLNYLNEEAVGS